MNMLPPDDASDAELEQFWAGSEGVALARVLADESVWVEPSPELGDHVVAAIERAAGVATPADVADLDARRARRRRLTTVAPWLATAVAAAVAVVLAVHPISHGTAHQFAAALVGTDVVHGARGTAEFSKMASGVEISLDVTGLPRVQGDSYYQAWVKGDRGSVAIGTFHTGGKITLWSGVGVATYPLLTVTLETEDGNPASSGVVVLTGHIMSN